MFRRFSFAIRPLLVLLLLVGSATWLTMTHTSAQDDSVTVTPDVTPFTKLKINGAGDATISIGDTPSLTIVASQQLQDLIDVSESDGTLTIGFVEGTVLDAVGQADIQYTIVATSLDEIHLSGSINATVDQLTADTLVLGLTTLAEITIDSLDVQTLDAKLDFASTAHLTGSADSQSIEILKGSAYDAESLDTRSTTVNLSELSTATVRVQESLTGSVVTGSTLEYIGENPTVDVATSSLGTVEALPFTALATPVASPVATPIAAAPSEASIAIRGFAFDPSTVTIAAGGTVTFTNYDFLVHDVASLPTDDLFHSPILAQGQAFATTFTEPGVYDYYCSLHPSMFGQITVVEQE